MKQTSVVVVVALLLVVTAFAAQPASRITVGPNVQVSAAHGGRAHWETRIGGDPASNRLIACSFIHSSQQNSFHTIVYISQDAGKSWQPTLESDRTNFIGDPDCIFGIDGAAYFATLPLQEEGSGHHETLVYRSKDGGLHWEQPLSLPFIDREYLAVDWTKGPRRGQIYLQGNNTHADTVDGDSRLVLNVYRSVDGGASFKPPVELLSDGDHMPFGNGSADVLSDGTYIATFPEWADRNKIAERSPYPKVVGAIKVVRSDDGGDSFDRANVVAPWYECQGSESRGLPMLVSDHTSGPFKDRVYVVWTDKQSGHCDIRFSFSADKGKTWAPSRVVNDDRDPSSASRTADHSMPVIAVNNKGLVGIAWYDRRDNPDGLGWYVRFTASLDGGETFLPSVRVSNAAQVPKRDLALPIYVYSMGGGTRSAKSRNAPEFFRTRELSINVTADQGEDLGGDTAGMAADGEGAFHPLWVDNRTGVLQLWSAAITVQGSALKHGGSDLAELNDVSRDVTLRYSNTNYDPKTGIMSFDATMVNTSKGELQGPFKVRVVGLRAGSGAAEILDSDNGETGSGSVWDFTSSITSGVLKPGEKSAPKRLKFRVTDIDPFRKTALGYIDPWLIQTQCVVLAKKQDKHAAGE